MLVLLVNQHSRTVILDLLFLAFRRLTFKEKKIKKTSSPNATKIKFLLFQKLELL
jgi:hypothetical protein